ncbi:glyoxylate/hydroxypyruvate reductase A [Pelagibius litoralis]|uniref:Glyoxylate/hydroxypyruvate reductase A n=1 Tax=Pelagibius litoralis TaxID=374515 RepID=A0A967EVD2_9PROT|nr:glyoxylate/hydroxypyruvate reductase A [Pelagibius litoralis]NIA67684.1 glyoxylate/hydroxypyruvate reductase A [Pelagibius litoralis]
MALVVRVGPAREVWWRDTLQDLLPDVECRLWGEAGDKDEVDYAVVWQPPIGELKTFRNLKCIVSMGAGVDHILLRDPDYPKHVPIIRTVGTDLRQRMREYVVLHVLRLHRRLPDIEAGQRRHDWDQIITPTAPDRRVGILGLGNMGADVAQALAGLGFSVLGWSRRPKEVAGVECHHGSAGLSDVLKQSEILVCLLPLTAETQGILNKDLFARMPKGANLINVGRGQHLVEEDLIPALDSGQLSRATLDVLCQEPPETDHPFWDHPGILLTPHVASLIDPAAGAKIIAGNLKRFIAGEPVPDMVDVAQGY